MTMNFRFFKLSPFQGTHCQVPCLACRSYNRLCTEENIIQRQRGNAQRFNLSGWRVNLSGSLASPIVPAKQRASNLRCTQSCAANSEAHLVEIIHFYV